MLAMPAAVAGLPITRFVSIYNPQGYSKQCGLRGGGSLGKGKRPTLHVFISGQLEYLFCGGSTKVYKYKGCFQYIVQFI